MWSWKTENNIISFKSNFTHHTDAIVYPLGENSHHSLTTGSVNYFGMFCFVFKVACACNFL